MVVSVGAVLTTTSDPVVIPVASVSWVRGADGAIQITVVDQNGAPVNLMGRSVAVGFRVNDGDASPLFVRAATLTDPTNGVCVAYLTAADTAGLATGRYRFDAWLVDTDGRRYQIVKASTFRVLEADTLPGEAPGGAAPISPVSWGVVDTVNTTGTTLASVTALGLTDGFAIWVRAEDSYFRLVIGKGYATDDPSRAINAFNLAGGQWVRGLGG